MKEYQQLLVDEKTMAKMLSISWQFLVKLRRLRKVPYYKIGSPHQGSVRYDPRKVEQALQKFAIEEEV